MDKHWFRVTFTPIGGKESLIGEVDLLREARLLAYRTAQEKGPDGVVKIYRVDCSELK